MKKRKPTKAELRLEELKDLILKAEAYEENMENEADDCDRMFECAEDDLCYTIGNVQDAFLHLGDRDYDLGYLLESIQSSFDEANGCKRDLDDADYNLQLAHKERLKLQLEQAKLRKKVREMKAKRKAKSKSPKKKIKESSKDSASLTRE